MGSRAAFSPYAQHVESLRYGEGVRLWLFSTMR